MWAAEALAGAWGALPCVLPPAPSTTVSASASASSWLGCAAATGADCPSLLRPALRARGWNSMVPPSLPPTEGASGAAVCGEGALAVCVPSRATLRGLKVMTGDSSVLSPSSSAAVSCRAAVAGGERASPLWLLPLVDSEAEGDVCAFAVRVALATPSSATDSASRPRRLPPSEAPAFCDSWTPAETGVASPALCR